MDTLHSVFVILAYTAAVGFLVFGIDDVFFDLQFLRYLRSKKESVPITLNELKNEPEQLIAIYIPAWMEGGIINRMAEYAKKVLIYDHYDIFIGVYPNDAETNRCVDELCRSGFRTGFIDYPVEREVLRRDKEGRTISSRKVTERVAVRENFPLQFIQAVKQKARWIVGTAFQGWEQGGWWGSTAVRYTLMRDRRAPLVHCINASGYFVMAYVIAEFLVQHSGLRNSFFLRPLFQENSLLWRIVLVDTALLCYRVTQKVSCVSDAYGLR